MHPQARLAAAAALAAHDQGKFWEMHDALFANQGNVTRETVAAFAAKLGLDCDRFTAAIDKGTFNARIDEEIALAKTMGVKGTPAFVINGVILFGNQPYADFKAAVDDAIARAEALVKAGVAVGDLDRAFVRFAIDHKGSPPAGAKAAPPADAAMRDGAVPDAPPIAEQYGLHNVRGGPEGHPAIPDRAAIPVAGSPTLGPDGAPVTIVVFSDFQCPYCAGVGPLIGAARDAFKDKVRVVFKSFPLDVHDLARPAAEAALSAHAQGRFWAMHDALFAARGGKALTREAIAAAAKAAGVDGARIEADIRAEAHRAQIDRDLSLGAELDVHGTPTLFVNGRKLAGAPTAEQLKAIIEQELKK
jgi:protein-disulfide isomerase